MARVLAMQLHLNARREECAAKALYKRGALLGCCHEASVYWIAARRFNLCSVLAYGASVILKSSAWPWVTPL